jgi:hypothetical protein
VESVIIVIVVAYLMFHAGHGLANYRHMRRKYRGHRVALYWNSFMGPWISVRLPGGFRIGHKL